MYAVLKAVGKQYKVSPGDILKIDKIEGKEGETIAFKDIVAVGGGDKFELGAPSVQGAEVSAKLLYQTRDDKIRVFRKNRRKHYERTKGHRQYITILKVLSIKSSIGEESYKEPPKKDVKPKVTEKKEVKAETVKKEVKADTVKTKKETVKKTTTKKTTTKVKE
jgi:large subunit ribosomal protein L21|tara:strand:- start:1291 stop:1782 length:492 start_codon:yes stop_codon:yes gene_type:complete